MRTRLRLLGVLAVGVTMLASTTAAHAAPAGPEPYRPQLHFSPAQNFMNDPNGLVYYQGVYHLYFQYNPSGNTAGNQAWGHATSPDLMHWTEQPIAIPAGPTEYIYSGSVVVDTDNTSGFGTKRNPPLVATYTSQYHDDPVHGNDEAQSIAYSTDAGMTWTKYAGNPVLDLGVGDFRDPKVFWYGSRTQGHWVMAAVRANESQIVLSRSADLTHWTTMSTFTSPNIPSFWECPDLFPMALDGHSKKTKWVMETSAGGSHQAYVVGDFDGTTFTEDPVARTTVPQPKGTALGSFDDGSYDGWTVRNDPTVPSGGPFGAAPATGAVDGQQPVTGFAGKGLVNSFLGQDAPIGLVTSPAFTVGTKYLNFLVGGGNHPRRPGTGTGEAPPGTVRFDFERNAGKSLADDGWTGTGGLNPADQPAAPHPQPNVAHGFEGTGYLSTYYTPDGNDDATGTLTSPTFTLTNKYLDLLVGGGRRDAGTGQTLEVQLVVDGQVVDTATGTDEHLMNWRSWDVSAYRGKQAQLRVVDTATGGWGAIWVDDVVQSDQPATPRSTETTVNLVVDGRTVESTTGPSDDGTIGPEAEFLNWHSWDLSAYRGKQAWIQIVDNNSGGFGHILADQFTAANSPAKPNPVPVLDQLDWGRDNYASTTYNNAPGGKRISVGWMGQAFQTPTAPWRSNDTLPRELSLQTIDGRPQIVTHFASQVASYEKVAARYSVRGKVSGTRQLPSAADGTVQRIRAEIESGSAKDFGIVVRGGKPGTGTRIGYDTTTQSVYIDRSHSGLIPDQQFATPNAAPAPLVHGRLTLDVVVDRGSVEVVVNGGRRIMTNLIYPSDADRHVSLYATGGSARVKSMTVTPMRASVYRG